MKTIGIILKKELKRVFTDPRMIIGIILPGLLIFLLYSVMGNFMSGDNSSEIKNFNVVVENEPVEFKSFLQNDTYEVNFITEFSKEEVFAKIENKEIDIYIIYPNNFYQTMTDYVTSPTVKAPNVEIYYNSASDASSTVYQYYVGCLTAFETAITNKFDINNVADTKFDLAKTEDVTVRIFTMMLPFLLIVFLFSGAMGICSESIAGEKERGTIATLLITPAKRTNIAIGKVIALGITSLVSSIVSLIGLMASLPRLLGTELSFAAYNASTIFMLLAVVVFTVLFFTVILTIVSTFAKSVKEASSYSIPVMIVVMLLGASSFMGTVAQSNPALYLIPVYNSIQVLTGILSLSIDPICFTIFAVSSVVYIGLGIFALTKMFNSEKVMFNN